MLAGLNVPVWAGQITHRTIYSLSLEYGEGAKDLLLTMAVPTIVMFAARLRPDLFRGSGRRRR